MVRRAERGESPPRELSRALLCFRPICADQRWRPHLRIKPPRRSLRVPLNHERRTKNPPPRFWFHGFQIHSLGVSAVNLAPAPCAAIIRRVFPKLLLPISLIALAVPLCAQDVQIRVGDVKDMRTTGQFFAGLDVELKLAGDSLGDAKSMRISIDSATDDTGRSLLDPQHGTDNVEGHFGQKNTIPLRLKNPGRKAATIKEITGTLELFMPKNDPESTVAIDGWSSKTNAPLDAPALQKAGVKITARDKAQFDAVRAKQKEEKKEKKGPDLGDAFGQFFGSGNFGENDIALEIEDPEGKVMEVEFQQANGKVIDTGGRSSSTSNKVKTMVLNFRQKLPENSKLMVYLSTPKAQIKVPLALKDIPLP